MINKYSRLFIVIFISLTSLLIGKNSTRHSILLWKTTLEVLDNPRVLEKSETRSVETHSEARINTIFKNLNPYLSRCPASYSFDFPVGPPDAKGYYNAQPFGKNDHLGEDWNGIGGGNTDLGDPIYAIADGVIFFARDIGSKWGNVVRIYHNFGTSANPKYIESLYGHLDRVYVKEGDIIRRGQQIGTMGNVNRRYYAHLHFEIRDKIGMPIAFGYSKDKSGYVDPTVFIKSHRGKIVYESMSSNKAKSKSIETIIAEKTIKYRLPPSLLMALIKVESNFNPNAVSSAGAIGLCQLMPSTAKSLGINPWNIEQNIDGGACYLRNCLKQFGSLEKALWAYNAGPGNVMKGRIPQSTKKFASQVLYWYR